MPSEVYLMWHKYPWIFGHLACDAKIVLTEGIAYSAVGTALAASVEKLVTYNTELELQHYCSDILQFVNPTLLWLNLLLCVLIE